MTADPKPTPEQIRAARAADPKPRERDFAHALGISEAEYVAAWCGAADAAIAVRRIMPFGREVLGEAPKLGEVMSLTRNDSAVHETIGSYGRFMSSGGAAAALGCNINLRLFFRHWAHGFAVARHDGETVRRSLQFFDAAGDAIQKIHLRPASNLDAYEALVERLIAADQSPGITVTPYPPAPEDSVTVETFTRLDELRRRWAGMADVHDFYPMLREIGVPRHVAVKAVGAAHAWPVETGAIASALEQVAASGMHLMCFVGSRGCVQIYGGPIHQLKTVGPWLNVMDPGFNLHLRTDYIAEVWALRRPITEGRLSSLDAYDGQGRLILQLFGARENGHDEPADWRALVDALPRLPHPIAA